MTKRHVYEVTIGIQSPFLFAGLEAARFGADASALRDTAGRPIIPAAHVKGHFSDAIQALTQAAKCADLHADLFGSTSVGAEGVDDITEQIATSGSQNEPNPGTLIFSDFTAKEYVHTRLEDLYNRVKIDEKSGAAEQGMLVMIEQVAAPLEIVNFTGQIALQHKSSNLNDLKPLLEDALEIIGSMGAMRSSGFGKVANYRVKDQTGLISQISMPSLDDIKGHDAARFAVDITFDRPILVNANRDADNMFTGSTVIPGTALKGALAASLGPQIFEDADFSNLTISHAWPVIDKQKNLLGDRTLPLSLVCDKNGAIYDLASEVISNPACDLHSSENILVRDGASITTLPDWKWGVFEKAMEILSRPDSNIPKLPRGRVQIDDDTSSAEEGKLFFTTAISNIKPDCEDISWRFVLDFSNIAAADRPAFIEKIASALQQGLHSIGKTKASSHSLKLTCLDALKLPAPKKVIASLCLETDAVMTDPRSKEAVTSQYERYFEWLLNGKGKLIQHFAQRDLAGGYVAFRRKAYGNQYMPFELTKAGSVFVISLETKGVEELQKAYLHGLPAIKHKDSSTLEPLVWQTCPYVPENGYGEFSISQDLATPFGQGRYFK